MQKSTKTFGLVFAMSLLAGSAFAAIGPQETVTVSGIGIEDMKADLDPLKDPDSFTGQEVARDINKVDRPIAFHELAVSLVGPLNQFYDWHGVRDDGHFIPTRQFQEAGLLCRDFTEVTQHHGSEGLDTTTRPDDFKPPTVFGTACHEGDGWHFR